MSWHKPVRIAVGVFGLAAAVAVYFAIGSRQTASAPAAGRAARSQGDGREHRRRLQQSRQGEEDFEVKADRTLNYEDGSAKMMGVRISVRKRDDRDFVVTAREASAGKDRKDLVLTGSVVLEASDGFRLTTEDATYTEAQGLVRAPGPRGVHEGRTQRQRPRHDLRQDQRRADAARRGGRDDGGPRRDAGHQLHGGQRRARSA